MVACFRLACLALVLASSFAFVRPAAGAPPALKHLTIVVPAAPDGGWDQLARAMKRALEAERLVDTVDVVNRPGAGGTIGLIEFITARRGDPTALLVTGTTMVGAIQANKASVSLHETTPIARLTDEDVWALAVPAGSPIENLDTLIEALRSNPMAVTFGGGSYGGPDHMLISLFAQSIGVKTINYVPFPGDAVRASRAGEIAVVVSGFGSVDPEARTGRLRVLALSGHRVAGVDAPVLMDGDRPIALDNWRGVVGPPGLDPADRERLLGMVAGMVKSRVWQSAAEEYAWRDSYLPAPAFASFLADEQQRAARGLGPYSQRPLALGPSSQRSPSAGTDAERPRSWLRRPGLGILVVGVLMLAGPISWYAWRRANRTSRQREIEVGDLRRELGRMTHAQERAESLIKGLGDTIDRQFTAWSLTSAEREVALLLLKGLKHKEIAELRRTTERTVRQQALAIYRKANLDGRTDLSAYFLEDILAPVQSDSPSV